MKKSKKQVFLLLILFILMPIASFADSSGELAYSLYSPRFLGSGASVISMDTPQSSSVNPAASGNFQRTIFDINYINLSGWKEDGIGHAVNTALAYPSRYGVITGAFHFLSTDGLNAPSMNFGTSGSLDFSFSKELYKNFFTGFGISTALGSGFDWGLGLNLGFIHKPESWRGLSNFTWGASINRLGKTYGSGVSGSFFNSVPNNMTLQLGAGFDIISKEGFTWSLNGDVGVPTFSDFKMGIGQEITIQDKLTIATSSSFILSDTIKGNYQTLIPSVGIYYNLTLDSDGDNERKIQSSEIEFQAAGAPLYDGTAAIGAGATIPFGIRDSNPPVITHNYIDTIYISPNLNGVQDELDFPFTVEDERYIMGYTFTIYDDDGIIVRQFFNKDERPENESFKNIFSRMFSEKTGTPIPETFRWDGIAESGELAEDGLYSFTLAFWDDNDNTATTDSMELVIDTVAPEIIMTKADGADLIFSPDGDGNKDTLLIQQDGSVEDLWTANITNQSGKVIRTFKWEYSSPESFEWDGTDDAGIIVYDGVYTYAIESRDAAGNYSQEILNNILINTEQPPIHLTIDNAWLSPRNAEGINTINFGPDIHVTSGIVEWELQVQDKSGRALWSYNNREMGILEIPTTIPYSGQAGMNGVLAEGQYKGYLSLVYQNGYSPETYSPGFTVDTTAPVGRVSGDLILSPDGDGNKDNLVLKLETSEEDYWEGFIKNENNETVRSYFWRGKADPELVWDGRDTDGRLVPDGSYKFHLEAFDKAGNRGVSKSHRFSLDTREMSVQLTVNNDAFSPNGNGVLETVDFFSIIDNPETVESWEMNIIRKEDKQTLKTFKGMGNTPETITWNGKSDSGSQVPDGMYYAELLVVYEKGDRPTAKSSLFEKDTQPPQLSLSSDRTLFSPDGDGLGDSIKISQSSSKESEWKAEILDQEGNSVRTWYWNKELPNLDWNGQDENGNILPDGFYSYRLSAVDKAGNASTNTLKNLEIDTSTTAVYITAERSFFSPVSEDYNEQKFAIHVSNDKGISQWALSIRSTEGTVVKTMSGKGIVPSELSWDGRDNNSKLQEGNFLAEIMVEYAKGNRPQAQSREFNLDNSAPEIAVTLSPIPFSPDDDNVDDELKMSLNVRDHSPIRDWNLLIKDPKGNEFISFGGKGRPSERIIWDGRSRQGELVQSAEDYPYELTVTDVLGHSNTVKGEIAVDILVIREGDRLKVRISNITFEPNQAALVSSGELGSKNQEILKRLSAVLKKYGSYRILIEGHAVSVYYDNKARAATEEKNELQPLSLSRASTVKEVLQTLGIQASRMDVEGKGGTDPVVPHSDLENRWKNRRVEFILIK